MIYIDALVYASGNPVPFSEGGYFKNEGEFHARMYRVFTSIDDIQILEMMTKEEKEKLNRQAEKEMRERVKTRRRKQRSKK